MTINPQVFRKAAAIVKTDGLAKGTYQAEDGSHCTVGAVMEALEQEGERADYLALLQEVDGYTRPLVELLGIHRPGNPDWTTVTQWNDQQERTATDVVRLLEQAAEKAEVKL